MPCLHELRKIIFIVTFKTNKTVCIKHYRTMTAYTTYIIMTRYNYALRLTNFR